MLGVDLRDELRGEGIERSLQTGCGRVTRVDQSLEAAAADRRRDIRIGSGSPIVAHIQEPVVGDVCNTGQL
jgi:hypothetical protein